MTKKELKEFIKRNPPNGVSAADFIDLQIRMLLHDEINDEIEKVTDQLLSQRRIKEETDVADKIAAIQTPDDVMRLMKQPLYFSNMTEFARKALQMEAEVMPLIVERYKKVKNEVFIENAVKIMAHADEKYARELLDSYKDIWLPYAQTLACYLFGYFKFMDAAPLLLKEYERLGRLYPLEDYDQSVMVALEMLMEEM